MMKADFTGSYFWLGLKELPDVSPYASSSRGDGGLLEEFVLALLTEP
jgi:hypothetical protein